MRFGTDACYLLPNCRGNSAYSCLMLSKKRKGQLRTSLPAIIAAWYAVLSCKQAAKIWDSHGNAALFFAILQYQFLVHIRI